MKALINDFGDETTMEKQHLPELLDDALLEKLYGFCYARTHDSLRAQELCSDIVLALVEASHAGGRLTEPYAFIWRVARNAAPVKRRCSTAATPRTFLPVWPMKRRATTAMQSA